MSLTNNNKLIFIDSFQFLSSSLDSLVKNLVKIIFKYLSQDLVKQKGFYPYEYMKYLEKFKEELPGKEKSYSSLTAKILVTKNMNMLLMFRISLK